MIGMSLSLVKAELKRRGLLVKGDKASLTARFVVFLKQEESSGSRFWSRHVLLSGPKLQNTWKLYRDVF